MKLIISLLFLFIGAFQLSAQALTESDLVKTWMIDAPKSVRKYTEKTLLEDIDAEDIQGMALKIKDDHKYAFIYFDEDGDYEVEEEGNWELRGNLFLLDEEETIILKLSKMSLVLEAEFEVVGLDYYFNPYRKTIEE